MPLELADLRISGGVWERRDLLGRGWAVLTTKEMNELKMALMKLGVRGVTVDLKGFGEEK